MGRNSFMSAKWLARNGPWLLLAVAIPKYGLDICGLLSYYKAKRETSETQHSFDSPSAKIREAMRAMSGHLHTLLPDAAMHFPASLAAQVYKAKKIMKEFVDVESLANRSGDSDSEVSGDSDSEVSGDSYSEGDQTGDTVAEGDRDTGGAKDAEGVQDKRFWSKWVATLLQDRKKLCEAIAMAADDSDEHEKLLRDKARFMYFFAVAAHDAMGTRQMECIKSELQEHARDQKRCTKLRAELESFRSSLSPSMKFVPTDHLPEGTPLHPRHKDFWSRTNRIEFWSSDRMASLLQGRTVAEDHPHVVASLAQYSRTLRGLDDILGSARLERLKKLLTFLRIIIGKPTQRVAMVLCWVLMAAHTFLEHAVMVKLQNDLIDEVTRSSGVGSAAVWTILRAYALGQLVVELLGKMKERVETWGLDSIRRSIKLQATKKIFALDLEDVEGLDHWDNKYIEMLESLSDADSFLAGLGGLLAVPSELIGDLTSILQLSRDCFTGSPTLFFSLLVCGPMFTLIRAWLSRLKRKIKGWLRIDNNVDNDMLFQWEVTEMIQHPATTKHFAQERDALKRMAKIDARSAMRSGVVGVVPELLIPATKFLNLNFVGFLVGSFLSSSGAFKAGNLLTFVANTRSLTETCENVKDTLTDLYNLTDERLQAGQELVELLCYEPTIGLDGGWPEDLDDHSLTVKGDIEFKDVSFHYPGKKEATLKHVSFSVPAGSFCALIGKRGCGKSTALKLLTRLYDTTSGDIFVGGRPLKSYNPPWIRSRIAMASQDTKIKYATLKENVVLGSSVVLKRTCKSAEEMDKRVEVAMRKAKIWDHFQDKEKFPQGLDSMLGDEALSGGEVSSIGLARAMVFERPIVVLDEPTASLDAKTEAEVMRNIVDKRPKGQTVICVAHRLSTIVKADLIVRFEGGEVAAEGSYKSLFERDEAFRELCQLQRTILEAPSAAVGHPEGGVPPPLDIDNLPPPKPPQLSLSRSRLSLPGVPGFPEQLQGIRSAIADAMRERNPHLLHRRLRELDVLCTAFAREVEGQSVGTPRRTPRPSSRTPRPSSCTPRPSHTPRSVRNAEDDRRQESFPFPDITDV